MHSAKNIVGRVLLFFSAPAFIYVAVALLIASITKMNDPAIGWFNFADDAARGFAIAFIVGIFFALLSISTVISGIRGKTSFISWIGICVSVFSILFSGVAVYDVVKGGALDAEFIVTMIMMFLSPVLYIVGDLLIAFSD